MERYQVERCGAEGERAVRLGWCWSPRGVERCRERRRPREGGPETGKRELSIIEEPVSLV